MQRMLRSFAALFIALMIGLLVIHAQRPTGTVQTQERVV